MGVTCDIAIIMPVFNEQDTISKVLRDIDDSLMEPAIVYLIADTSDDPTILAAEAAAVGLGTQIRLIIQNGGQGPASAIKCGIESSSEKYIVFMTADDSDDARDVPLLISSLKAGATLVCASRYAKGGQHIGGPRLKHFLSWMAGQIVYRFKGLNTCDPTNLFKAVQREFLDDISIDSKFGFTLGIELVGKANVASQSIVEIPTIWHERIVGASSFKTLKWLPTYIYWFLRLIFSK
jgi:glycosyltransferase involved in cell wall biosynthesis